MIIGTGTDTYQRRADRIAAFPSLGDTPYYWTLAGERGGREVSAEVALRNLLKRVVAAGHLGEGSFTSVVDPWLDTCEELGATQEGVIEELLSLDSETLSAFYVITHDRYRLVKIGKGDRARMAGWERKGWAEVHVSALMPEADVLKREAAVKAAVESAGFHMPAWVRREHGDGHSEIYPLAALDDVVRIVNEIVVP